MKYFISQKQYNSVNRPVKKELVYTRFKSIIRDNLTCCKSTTNTYCEICLEKLLLHCSQTTKDNVLLYQNDDGSGITVGLCISHGHAPKHVCSTYLCKPGSYHLMKTMGSK